MNKTNPITDPNLNMVSGPVNVMRLEGNVNGIKKVIYLFMDYHMNVDSQTQCSNVFSQDVQKFFTNNFYDLSNNTNGNQMYDFFVEVYPSELADNKYRQGINGKDHKEKYIEEVVKFFRKIFNYDAKKNKVTVNKFFKNVRLHYIDIRDYYKHNVHNQVTYMNGIAHQFMINDYIDLERLDEIIKLMELMRTHLEFVIDILAKSKHKSLKMKIIKENFNGPLDVDAINYLANKIKTSYKHNNVKKVMLALINDTINNFESSIKEIDDAINEFNEYYDDIYKSNNRLVKDENTSYIYSYGLSLSTVRQMIVNIANRVDNLVDEKFVEFFARFTDIYFLRRFLDKDYITNAITYTGALHSNTYVYTLVKYFNFQITHASYSKISDMKKLTNKIKKRSLMGIQELILPEVFNQCSNLTDFPADFL